MKRSEKKAEPIEKIRKKFHGEWLLIGVDKVNEATTTVTSGRLLAHNTDPMKIHKVALKYRGRTLMTVYSDDWPKDLAAAFHVYLSPLH